MAFPQESSTKIHTQLEKPTGAVSHLPPPSGKVPGGDGLAGWREGGRAALRYLWVLEAADVGVQVELDACARPRQRQPTNQQHQQHGEREGGREIDNLQGKEGLSGGGARAPPAAVKGEHLF